MSTNRTASEDKLVQIWSEYSIVFPLLTAYVVERCAKRQSKNIISHIQEYSKKLEAAK